MTTHEVAPRIYRIESILGPRSFAQDLLRDERSLLVDTGIASTPDKVSLSAFQALGLGPADLEYVLDIPITAACHSMAVFVSRRACYWLLLTD